MQVVYEDNHIIIVSKKAGEIVQGDITGDRTLCEDVKAYIKDRLQGKTQLDLRRVFITHSGVPDEIIETAKAAVLSYQNFEEICVTRAGCTVSSHCGPGTIGVLFLYER